MTIIKAPKEFISDSNKERNLLRALILMYPNQVRKLTLGDRELEVINYMKESDKLFHHPDEIVKVIPVSSRRIREICTSLWTKGYLYREMEADENKYFTEATNSKIWYALRPEIDLNFEETL